MVYIVAGGKGRLLVEAVYAAGAGVNKMAYFVAAAALQQIGKANYVALYVCCWIFEAVTHPGLGG